ncbi:matrixin family metalloprotease [Knoellia sp. LjRoot47]|uniref:matrixin family metalloprotease n=1 Tax=Knoellia sp. LjRoot47 TaxID=3342330 RepID=UPI003ED16DA1
MRRRLAELDRLDAVAAASGSLRPTDAIPYAVTPTSRRRRLTALPLVVALVTGGLLWVRTAATEQIDHVARVIPVEHERPPVAVDVAPGRLLPPPVAPPGSGGYTFMSENTLGPAAYDPCRPLHLVVNYEAAPDGADGILREALAMIVPAAGLQIVIDGPTDERAREQRPAMDRDRYGNEWSPALIAWTTPASDPRLDGETLGIGGSQAVADDSGRLRSVTGMIHLDGPDISLMLSRVNGHVDAVAVVAHELGHLLGLGHIDDPSQLMVSRYDGQVGLGDGDRRGLARLAEAPCARGV